MIEVFGITLSHGDFVAYVALLLTILFKVSSIIKERFIIEASIIVKEYKAEVTIDRDSGHNIKIKTGFVIADGDLIITKLSHSIFIKKSYFIYKNNNFDIDIKLNNKDFNGTILEPNRPHNLQFQAKIPIALQNSCLTAVIITSKKKISFSIDATNAEKVDYGDKENNE